MPLYEFRCPQGHDFEKFYRSMSAAQSVEKCPECGALGARLMSPAGLVFKGSGFYITDYGKDGKKAERAAATAKAEAGNVASGAADTKPSATDTPAVKAATETAAPAPAKASGESSAKAKPTVPAKKSE